MAGHKSPGPSDWIWFPYAFQRCRKELMISRVSQTGSRAKLRQVRELGKTSTTLGLAGTLYWICNPSLEWRRGDSPDNRHRRT
jgi:hypothetical protein